MDPNLGRGWTGVARAIVIRCRANALRSIALLHLRDAVQRCARSVSRVHEPYAARSKPMIYGYPKSASGTDTHNRTLGRSNGRARTLLDSVFTEDPRGCWAYRTCWRSIGAQGGTRTHTSQGHRNLNPACLPIPTPGRGREYSRAARYGGLVRRNISGWSIALV